MNCKEFLEHLDAWIDGEVTPAQRQAFLSHAQGCSACRKELRDAEAIRDALSQMNEGLSVPLAAQAAWRNAVKRESHRRRGRVFYRALSAAAAAFVLLAGTTAIFRSTGVLDLDAPQRAASGVHIATSAPKAEFYDAAPEAYSVAEDPTVARYAQLEADGEMIAGDAEDTGASADPGIAPASMPILSAEEQATVAESAASERLFVRSAVRELHSDTFDATYQSIGDLVEEYNGHVVTDTLTGQEGARDATIAADVPTAELDAFLQALDFVAEVTYSSVNSEDISDNYYDAQGRLETLRLERDRLNELISTASDSAELQALDSQLKDVYAQIDTLESKLRNFDSQLEYARVDIVLREGAPLAATAITGGTNTGSAASQGLNRSMEAIGSFFHDMGVSLAVIAPYAGIAVAVALVVGLIWLGISRLNRRRRHDGTIPTHPFPPAKHRERPTWQSNAATLLSPCPGNAIDHKKSPKQEGKR